MRSPRLPVQESMYSENRFKMLTRTKPEDAKRLLQEAQEDVDTRWQMYQYLAARHLESPQHSDDDQQKLGSLKS